MLPRPSATCTCGSARLNGVVACRSVGMCDRGVVAVEPCRLTRLSGWMHRPPFFRPQALTQPASRALLLACIGKYLLTSIGNQLRVHLLPDLLLDGKKQEEEEEKKGERCVDATCLSVAAPMSMKARQAFVRSFVRLFVRSSVRPSTNNLSRYSVSTQFLDRQTGRFCVLF